MAVQIDGILFVLLLAFGLATAVKILYKNGAFDSNISPTVLHKKFSIELFEGLCNVDTSFEQVFYTPWKFLCTHARVLPVLGHYCP